MDESEMSFVIPDRHKSVILELVKVSPEPEYCVHGRVTCVGCGEWLWLGSGTYEIVAKGKAAPMCIPCAQERAETSEFTLLRNVRDHR